MTVYEIIKATDWHKKWSVPNYTLLSCSLMNEGYDASSIEKFGAGLPHELYIYRDETIICYQSNKETENFGLRVASLITEDERYLPEQITQLEDETKAFRKLLEKPLTLESEKAFTGFKEIHVRYLPTFAAVIRSAGYVSGKNRKKILNKLERVRLATEMVYVEADQWLVDFLELVAQQEGYQKDLLTRLHYTELENYFASKVLPPKEELATRIGLYYYHDVYQFLNEKQVKVFEKAVAESYSVTRGYVRGQTAFPGKTKGTVRIVVNPAKVSKFNEGDILVTGMTRPEFVPLMKKAGAIVTDAGGILSHAAIVARELKKPCIIGTQTATKAFKDGDEVEVDAEKGIIRKLS
jgi:phosphohistidine swiveling domain-containing protein